MKTARNQSKNSFTPKKFAFSGQIRQSSIAANLLCKFQEKSMSKNLMKCSHVLMFSLSLSLCVFVCSARVYLRLSQLVGVAARCGWRWIDELFFFSCCTHQVLLHQLLLLLLLMITKDHHQQNQTHDKTQQQTTRFEVWDTYQATKGEAERASERRETRKTLQLSQNRALLKPRNESIKLELLLLFVQICI